VKRRKQAKLGVGFFVDFGSGLGWSFLFLASRESENEVFEKQNCKKLSSGYREK
jgi:hypothetical protein